MSDFHVSPLALVASLFGGALLYALSRWLRGVLSRVPLGASQRRALARLRPLAEALMLIAYVVFSVPFVFRGHQGFSAVVLAFLVLALTLVAWFAIRDAVAGIFLKAGDLCQLGDVVTVDDHRGTVRGLGLRVLALETEEGEEVFVPYTRISRSTLVRSSASDGAHRHTFQVARPPGLDPFETKGAIRRLALTSHWAAAARGPEVDLTEEAPYVVTVYALEADRAHDVEEHVRRGLKRLSDAAEAERR